MIASVNSQLQPGIDGGGMKSFSNLLEAIIKVRTNSIILFREFRFSNVENFTGSWILVCVFYSHCGTFFFFFSKQKITFCLKKKSACLQNLLSGCKICSHPFTFHFSQQ